MAPPKLNAEAALVPSPRVYAGVRFSRRGCSGFTAQEGEDSVYSIRGCVRSSGSDKEEFPEHCYAKLSDETGKTLDSLSFDHVTPAGGRDSSEDDSSSICETVIAKVGIRDWNRLKEHFKKNCPPERWTEEYNCCTCLREGIKTVYGKESPNVVQNANFGK